MLNPSRLSQRKVSEEDSSGSEAGSDVSLEPETDRFGFIVTNGSTAGSVGPSPELVRQREAKWINIIGQWDHILVKKSSKVKVQCQKGIPASLRAKCWPLLCGASDQMKQNNKIYKCLDSQPGLQSWVDVIERDLDRQFPFHEMFLSKDGHGQRGLFRVLKAYTQYQPQEGYCQAQGPVAAVLLMNMPAEEAFWCLVQISEQYLPAYYNPLLEGVLFDAGLLTWALKKTCPAAHKHLQHHGVEPLMFATDWLMCLFTRHLPFNTLLRVWDLFFCYGVRVLLQVAVVLVRRALGRPDQRKKCQGQVETLESLRGIRDQIQDEDNAFIAEVCSVPLSAKDLEKQTEKELQKWRKDRPSSTFDPRGRCQGYRMAWAKARQSQEEQDRKERERGNLSVPLARSASTLSLSPSLLHKRWRKGGKVNTSEGEGKRVVRHLSMGAKEDWRSWTNLNFRKVQCFQEEDAGSEGHEAESESTVKVQTEQREISKETESKSENSVKAIIKEQVETVEIRLTETEESQLKETEECKIPLKHKEETFPIENQDGDEDNPTEEPSHCVQEEKPHAVSQFQVVDQPSQECSDKEKEGKDTDEKREKQEPENEPADEDEDGETLGRADAETNTVTVMQVCESSSEAQVAQADVKPQESHETQNVQQVQTDSVAEVSKTETETRPDSETNNDLQESTDETPPNRTETQQEHEEVTEEDSFKEKYHSSESLEEPEEEESYTQTKADNNELEETKEQAGENAAMQDRAPAEMTQTVSESDTKTRGESLIVSERIQEKEEPDFQDDTGTEDKLIDIEDTTKEPNEAEACISAQGNEVSILTLNSDILAASDSGVCDQSLSQETPTGAQAADSVKPVEQEEASTQNQSIKVDLVETLEAKAPEQPTSQVTLSSAVEEQTVRDPQESPAGEIEVFTCAEPTDGPIPDDNPPIQDKDAPSKKDQSEWSSNTSAEASSHHSSRFSGDFCVRKPSSSRGSKLTRRLSEDLFTSPQKITQSQIIPNQAESQTPPAAADVTKAAPGVRLPTEVSEDAPAQEESHPQPDAQKRLGLFGRLRRKQPRNNKTKGTPKMQVPKILIQDFSDVTEAATPVEEEAKEQLTSKDRRRIRRERERREKEEERLKKKTAKAQEKDREQERRKPQTRGKSFQGQKEKDQNHITQKAKTESKRRRSSATFAESYF